MEAVDDIILQAEDNEVSSGRYEIRAPIAYEHHLNWLLRTWGAATMSAWHIFVSQEPRLWGLSRYLWLFFTSPTYCLATSLHM